MSDSLSSADRDARIAAIADLRETVRRIVRTPDDVADFMIAEFEASTGLTATAEDIAEARRMARNGEL